MGCFIDWDKIQDAAYNSSKERYRERLLKKFGGIHTCPWCRQIAQEGEGWTFESDRDEPGTETLTCGVCKGTSLWIFGFGMMFVRSLNPPIPTDKIKKEERTNLLTLEGETCGTVK